MTVTDLLLNKHFRGNQSQLAKEMKLNRGTLRRYLLDIDGDDHIVKEVDGEYVLFTKTGGK